MSTPEDFTAALRRRIAELEPFPAGRFADDGIVLCAGGPRLFTCAWVLLTHLRGTLGCELPVEVWHIGPEEIGPPMRSLLEDFGKVTVVDALEVARSYPLTIVGGWELKPYAIQHSRFERALFIDADNLPVRDPGFLLDAAELASTGAIFWPDIVRLRADNPVWELCDVAYRDMPSFETGQIALDKSKCWPALSLVTWLNQHSELLYDHIYGDKDTFLLGWLLTGTPFHLIGRTPKQIPFTLCQYDLTDQILFQHRTRAKWVPYGVNRSVEGFKFEADCLAAIRNLRSKWNGKVFHPPARGSEAIQLEGMLSDHRNFQLTIVGSRTLDLELLPAQRIGRGSDGLLRYWYVEEEDGARRLVLEGNDGTTARLEAGADGVWRGTMLVEAKMPLLLEAVDTGRSGDWSIEPPSADGELYGLAVKTLQHYRRLPLDANVERDLEGALRSFLRLDPGLRDRLADWADKQEREDPVQALVRRILDAAVARRGTGDGGIRRGHNTFTATSNIDRKYEKSN